MSAKMTSSKRFIVRTVLVTSTTLATIMGAQALASVDGAMLPEQTIIQTGFVPQATNLPQPSNTNISAAAPNIVILRRAGEQTAVNNTAAPPTTIQVTQSQIQPPNAVQVAPLPPMVQPVPRTRSSR